MRSAKRSVAARAVLATSSAAALVVLSPVLARADHKDNGTSTLDRDNDQQDVDKVSLTSAGNLACDWGKAQLERSEVTTSWGATDVHCHDSAVAEQWVGRTKCINRTWTIYRCDQYELTFNYYYLDVNPDTNYEIGIWRNAGCHEFGHTSSLGHRAEDNNNSCMQPYASENRQTFDQHDLDSINSDI